MIPQSSLPMTCTRPRDEMSLACERTLAIERFWLRSPSIEEMVTPAKLTLWL